MEKTVVVAIGGNAITQNNQKGTVEEQFANVAKVCDSIINLLEAGYRVVLTHGNGPQVGNLLIKNEAGKLIVPEHTLDVCGAETSGSIGYIIEQSLQNRLVERHTDKKVATVITETVVDKNDKAFLNPTKPIGPFFTEEESRQLEEEKGYHMIEDSGRGYRRVVPSPKPLEIVEKDVIKTLSDAGYIVICAGGGGIPVIYENGRLKGIEAVVDKDRASSLLAERIGADYLMILTGVEKVAINYGRPDMVELDELTIADAEKYMAEGQFPAGSMGPKVESACDFIKGSKGREACAIITSLDKMEEAMEGKTGTRIVNMNNYT